jgi:hypothetical protein
MPAVVRTLLVGEAESTALWAAEAALSELVAQSCVRRMPDLASLRADSSAVGEPCDLAVVCQSWSDEHAAADVEWLLTAFPLARVVCCSGEWCASDGRRRSVWPGAVRVPAWQIAQRLRTELRVLAGKVPPLPLTAGRDEVFAGEHGLGSDRSAGASVAVAVAGPDAVLCRSIEEALAAAGCRVAAIDGEPSPDVLLVDIDPWSSARAAWLANLRGRCSRSAVVALAGFPWPDLAAELAARGAVAVVPKLGPQSALVTAVQHAADNVA